jgi:regulatory protein
MAGTITALELQEHNRERVNVFLDGAFAFGLTLIEAARLRKGQYLTDSEIAALRARDGVEQAYDRAVKFLGQRPRSTGEIRHYLGDKQIDLAAIDEVIARLESQGYVDDLAFARYWVANRQQFRPRGARALRFELREKGLSPSAIDEALDGFDADDAAYQAALDQARRFRGLDCRAFREKLGSFLTRRGFDYDTAREVINRLIREFEEEDAGAFVPSQDEQNELDDIEE